MNIKIFFYLFLLSLMPISGFSYEQTQVSRYVTISNEQKKEQIDLLRQTVHVRFPKTVGTVGDAINYLVGLSGYGLVSENKRSDELKIILTKSLPTIDREIGPTSLKTALITLIGKSFNLIDDPINRTVNFKIKTKT